MTSDTHSDTHTPPHILIHPLAYLHSLKMHKLHLIQYENEGRLLGQVDQTVGGGLQLHRTPERNTKKPEANRDTSLWNYVLVAEREARRIIVLPDSGPCGYIRIYICLQRMWVGLPRGALRQ